MRFGGDSRDNHRRTSTKPPFAKWFVSFAVCARTEAREALGVGGKYYAKQIKTRTRT